MRKLTFFIFSFILILSVSSFLTINNASAASIEEIPEKELNIDQKEIHLPVNQTTPITVNPGEQEVTPNFINDFRYRKKNVTTTYEWSPYKRVSRNLDTHNSAGGAITSDRVVEFNVEVSGDVSGLGFSLNLSVSNAKGYTLNVAPDKVVYMGYRVRYKVEKGTRELYDIVTGKVISSNKYTIKTPMYGEYKLINY